MSRDATCVVNLSMVPSLTWIQLTIPELG